MASISPKFAQQQQSQQLKPGGLTLLPINMRCLNPNINMRQIPRPRHITNDYDEYASFNRQQQQQRHQEGYEIEEGGGGSGVEEEEGEEEEGDEGEEEEEEEDDEEGEEEEEDDDEENNSQEDANYEQDEYQQHVQQDASTETTGNNITFAPLTPAMSGCGKRKRSKACLNDPALLGEVIQVNCNGVVAELHKKKFGSGGKGHCIRVEVKGGGVGGDRSEKWMTPIEFENFCGKGDDRFFRCLPNILIF